MSKAKNSSSVINWIVGAAAAYFTGSAIVGAIKRKRTQGTSGIGDLPVWNKRRIYDWFAYEHFNYPEKIVASRPYYVNDGEVEIASYSDKDSRFETRDFAIKEKDLDWLKHLCKEHRVLYIEL